MSRETGGPAFPTGEQLDRSGKIEQYKVSGMSLRDYFAAKAMQGLMSSNINASKVQFAKHSYEMADALLEARGE